MALPPETAGMLEALEAFLDDQPPRCFFHCIHCHDTVSSDFDLIQDLHPFSMSKLLFDRIMVAVGRAPIRHQYVGEHPAGSPVDLIPVQCVSCGNWLGWKIHRQYAYHPVIREGQVILQRGGRGGGGGIEVAFVM